MALSVPKAPGVSQMLKDGARVSESLREKKKILQNMPYFTQKIGENKTYVMRYRKHPHPSVDAVIGTKKKNWLITMALLWNNWHYFYKYF